MSRVLGRAVVGVDRSTDRARPTSWRRKQRQAGEIDRDALIGLAFQHQCLGQSLTRAELQIVFDTLLRRIPGLRLAVPREELVVKDDAVVYGLSALPVTW